jgi:hypothetical protein
MRHWTFWEWVAYGSIFVAAIIITVLELPPVESPETAVKVAIAAKARELGAASG